MPEKKLVKDFVASFSDKEKEEKIKCGVGSLVNSAGKKTSHMGKKGNKKMRSQKLEKT